MATPNAELKQERLETDVAEMNIKEEQHYGQGDVNMDTKSAPEKKERSASNSRSATPKGIKRQHPSPVKDESMAQSPLPKTEVVGGGVELRLDEYERPRLVRNQSQKVARRTPELFTDLPDATAQATSTFSILLDCVYANKQMGITEHALECDCAEEWDAISRTNNACGDDSDCINRATKMECIGDCGCGANCQNMRFQNKEWADVSVIQTEKKGFGLRANVNLGPHEFIFEYIGEVIGENSFRKRMSQYDEEGIKHFYFMSLSKGEFVDATKKGNLGRFCNHSCNPNCYVDKWVVGDRLRMGIFAGRSIRAGEELTFNYNVDRYGADPQPCYCGEYACVGFIGGKTQTERSTKLSQAIIEALGIDDADAWDTATAKKPRKKKASEDDEEYVNNIEPRGLDEEGVNKVMSSLMQCKEKWIAVKLLSRIQRADDEKVRNRVVRFHGYRILKGALSNFKEDVNVCLQVLDVLDKMPRLTRNKIQDSKIEEVVQELTENEDDRVVAQSKSLLDAWSKLEIGYRIPRVKRDPSTTVDRARLRREIMDRRRSRSRSRSKSPERFQAPTGPRSNAPQRAAQFGARPPPRFRPPPPNGHLPPGWSEATAPNGAIYYYSKDATTWQRPTAPAAAAPPPPPPKAISDQQMLQELIQNIVSSANAPAKQPSNNATPADTPKKERKEEKWRSLPEEKQKKLYEATLQPHIMHVVGKYKHKLAKDDLKRWAKEFAKKMVESDFKKGRIEDPSKISDKQAKSVKKHAQDFFEKAVKKKEEADKRRSDKKAKQEDDGSRTPAGSPPPAAASPMDKDDDVHLSDDEVMEPEATPAESNQSTDTLKRRMEEVTNDEADDSVLKKARIEADNVPPPPPPPPPPPAEDPMETEDSTLTPNEDVSASFTHQAIAAVHAASMEDMQASGGAESRFAFKGAASRPSSALGNRRLSEVTQTATPPTTGSPDPELGSMHPERMQQLGLDGAGE